MIINREKIVYIPQKKQDFVDYLTISRYNNVYFIIGGTRSKKTNKIQSQTQKHPHLIQKYDGLCDAVNVIFEPERILDGIEAERRKQYKRGQQ